MYGTDNQIPRTKWQLKKEKEVLIMKKINEMTVKEIIKSYSIKIVARKSTEEDVMFRVLSKISASEQAYIVEHKEEIKAILKAEDDARIIEAAQRKAKIEALDGLDELRDTIYECRALQSKLDHEIDIGLSVYTVKASDIDALEDRIAELKRAYPRTAAYLKYSTLVTSLTDAELSAIASEALEKVLDGEDLTEIKSDYDAKNAAFVAAHQWN